MDLHERVREKSCKMAIQKCSVSPLQSQQQCLSYSILSRNNIFHPNKCSSEQTCTYPSCHHNSFYIFSFFQLFSVPAHVMAKGHHMKKPLFNFMLSKVFLYFSPVRHFRSLLLAVDFPVVLWPPLSCSLIHMHLQALLTE